MSPVTEDFVILFLPCIAPAHGGLSVNCPVSLELNLCDFFEALVETEFLHKGSVLAYYLRHYQLGTTVSQIIS